MSGSSTIGNAPGCWLSATLEPPGSKTGFPLSEASYSSDYSTPMIGVITALIQDSFRLSAQL
ncbi:MAG: hypothetical protein ACI9R3_006185 [Verrucomicrobiales bacterium]|jgi:hypothetical protein